MDYLNEIMYYVELSRLNVIFISIGIVALSFVLSAGKWHLKRKYARETNDLIREIMDLKDQKHLLMDKNLQLENALKSTKHQLKEAKKEKQHYLKNR